MRDVGTHESWLYDYIFSDEPPRAFRGQNELTRKLRFRERYLENLGKRLASFFPRLTAIVPPDERWLRLRIELRDGSAPLEHLAYYTRAWEQVLADEARAVALHELLWIERAEYLCQAGQTQGLSRLAANAPALVQATREFAVPTWEGGGLYYVRLHTMLIEAIALKSPPERLLGLACETLRPRHCVLYVSSADQRVHYKRYEDPSRLPAMILFQSRSPDDA